MAGLAGLWRPGGAFADDEATRADLERLQMDADVIEAFAAAVAELDFIEITGQGGSAEFRRAGGGRWAVVRT